MNRASILAFGITAAVLAAATWNDSGLTADDENAAPWNVLTVGNVTVTAELREVEVEGARQQHLFLRASGTGKGSVTLRLEEMGGSPMSRVAMPSTTHWQRTITLDRTGDTTETDLGALPGSQAKGQADTQERAFRGSMYLIAMADDVNAVTLWSNQPSFGKVLNGLEELRPELVGKADE